MESNVNQDLAALALQIQTLIASVEELTRQNQEMRLRLQQEVEVSKQTRNPTNPVDPARKPANPTLVTVNSGSLPIKPKASKSVDGFEHEK